MRHVGKGVLATIQLQEAPITDATMALVGDISARVVGSGGYHSMVEYAVSTLSPLPKLQRGN